MTMFPPDDTPRPASLAAVPPASPSSADRNRSWHQKSLGRKVTTFVQGDLETVRQQSIFLQQPPVREHALLSRHEIITGRRLGQGGFAHVYEVRRIQLDSSIDARLSEPQRVARQQLAANCLSKFGVSRFAIKHLQPQLYGTDKKKIKDFAVAVADLVVEGTFLSRMDHDHVLKLQGLPVDGIESLLQGKHDSYFLVLDKLDGTLDHSLQRWKVQDSSSCANLDVKLDYALQLSQALEYLHDNRIMFRDLKPHNIGLKDGKIRLFDFGLVREYPAEARTEDLHLMSLVGTRRYLAPEIVNSSTYNQKADVYSWSLVLWEMLSLERPFARHSVEDHRKAVCQRGERPELDHDAWPASVCELLRACWTSNVSERLAIEETRMLLASIVEARKQYLSAVTTTGVPTDPGIEVIQQEKGDLINYSGSTAGASDIDSSVSSRQCNQPFLLATSSLLVEADDDDEDGEDESFLTNHDWIMKHASDLLTLNEDSETSERQQQVPVMGDWSASSSKTSSVRPQQGIPPVSRPLQLSVTV